MENIFSPNEQKILKVLGKRKKSIIDITEEIYKEDRPVSANTVVANAIRRINEKCRYHKLAWFLNGAGLGRGGKVVWKDKS